jgi:cytochrome c oxidase subunit II
MILPAAGAFPLAAMSEIATLPPWLPTGASLHAPAIDRLMGVSLIVLLALCVAAQILLLLGLVFRRRQGLRISGSWRWGAIAVMVVFFVWMTAVSEHLWSVVRLSGTQPDAVRVEVTGVQFQWYFRYPGSDGIYGRTQPDLIDASGGNPLGLDSNDPRSRDDVVSSVLVLPVNRQVELTLRAQDVVHGFFIPSMRLMQNATPGSESVINLTPTRLGDYPIVCSQLCGLGHYRMRAVLRVVSDKQFAGWLKNREAQRAER